MPREDLRPLLRSVLVRLRGEASPLELRLLGRTLLEAVLVGLVAGLFGAAFLYALEAAQRVLLEEGAGYVVLRARGELSLDGTPGRPFRPWLLLVLPAVGALAAGAVIRWAPEAAGGGGDEMLRSIHERGGFIRRRVLWIKSLASILTLGSGGSGGREGPTMLIGATLGSMTAGLLRSGARERRILVIAGVAAGMAAVFRTPLGAALLATEVLYRDDFESDALVPAILASVVAYALVVSIHGEATFFAHAPRYPFHAVHLPLYALFAVLVAALGALFVATLRGVRRWSDGLPVPAWTRPGIGGLGVGIIAVPVVWYVGMRIGSPGHGLGILGGGYGAAQVAVTGAPWLPEGWKAVELLLLLCGAKLVASSLTIGTGGSAGDFAPSLVLGAIFGGAFGRAAGLLLHDPSIDPGAFALVGMGAFYGGVAHVPLSALVLVSELSGSYDLLVPAMLANGIAYVALRRRSLYEAQLATRREAAPAGEPGGARALFGRRVSEFFDLSRAVVTFSQRAPAREVLTRVAAAGDQDIFPVLDEQGRLVGVIPAESLRLVASNPDAEWAIAADLMTGAVSLHPEDTLRTAVDAMLDHHLHGLPVVDSERRLLGLLDETAATRAVVDDLERPASREVRS